MVTIDEFKKVSIQIGEIKKAEKVPETDKLLRLEVDFGEEKIRQVVSGIALYFPEPEVLVGKKCSFVTNLEPRIIRGLESQAMILASVVDGKLSLLEPTHSVPSGSSVG